MKDSAYKELINKEGRALPQEKKAAAADLFEKHFEKYQSYELLFWTIWKMKQRGKDIVDNAGLFLCDSMNDEVKRILEDHKEDFDFSPYTMLDNMFSFGFRISEQGKEFEERFNTTIPVDAQKEIAAAYIQYYLAEQAKYYK